MTLSVRFFAAEVRRGRIRVRGIPDRGPWERARLEWAAECEIDPCLVLEAGDRKIRTREELHAILGAAAPDAPGRFVWIHESLADEAERLWKTAGLTES